MIQKKMGEINQHLKSTMETPSLHFENFIQWEGMIILMKDNMVQENYKNNNFRIIRSQFYIHTYSFL